ncbi:MAG TPA: hypothetical protein VMH86_17640 [Rhizomicrobium sp.]|nr:hypothetical protein [Rhizomicrobium sp.]
MTLITDALRPPPEANARPFALPAALVAAFLLQTAGALFWAGSAAERIATLERTAAQDQSAIEQVAVLEEQAAQMKQSLDRIEAKLDRLEAERTR